jgi:hypothetical protein
MKCLRLELGAACLYSPDCLEGAFSETPMQPVASLSNRTGAKGLLRPDRNSTRPQHVVGVHGYARITLSQRTGVGPVGVGTRPAPDRGTPSGGGADIVPNRTTNARLVARPNTLATTPLRRRAMK